MDKVEKLKELNKLLETGSINENEYQKLKNEIINDVNLNSIEKDISNFSENEINISGNKYIQKINNIKNGLVTFYFQALIFISFGVHLYINQDKFIIEQAGSRFNFISRILGLINPIEIVFYLIWINSILWGIALLRIFYLSIMSYVNKENYTFIFENDFKVKFTLNKFEDIVKEFLFSIKNFKFYKSLFLPLFTVLLTYGLVWAYSGVDLFRSRVYTIEFVQEEKYSLSQDTISPYNNCYSAWNDSSAKIEAGSTIPVFFTTTVYYPLNTPLLNTKLLIDNGVSLNEFNNDIDTYDVENFNHSYFSSYSHKYITDAIISSSIIDEKKCTFTIEFVAPIFSIECYGFCKTTYIDYNDDEEAYLKSIDWNGNLEPHLHRSVSLLIPESLGSFCEPTPELRLGRFSNSYNFFWEDESELKTFNKFQNQNNYDQLWRGYSINWYQASLSENQIAKNSEYECPLFDNYIVPFWYGEEKYDLIKTGFMRVDASED